MAYSRCRETLCPVGLVEFGCWSRRSGVCRRVGAASAFGATSSSAASVTDGNGAQLQFGFGRRPLGAVAGKPEAGKSPIGNRASPTAEPECGADFYIFGRRLPVRREPWRPAVAETVKTVAAGTDPEWIAVSPDGKSVYVTNHNSKTSPSTTSAATDP